VTQDEQSRVQQIKHYVIVRLREELANAPRGAQARLAKQLEVSGAHLSNMLSTHPTRQPGEDFRRKVATHWGVSYAQLAALALGEEPPPSHAGAATSPPNLTSTFGGYPWTPELPPDLRILVREQARLHYAYGSGDLPSDEWYRILRGLEREAMAFVARRTRERNKKKKGPSSTKR